MVQSAFVNAFGSSFAWSHPVSTLPYSKLIHWLYGAACLVFQSQYAFSVWWALFVPSLHQPSSEEIQINTSIRVILIEILIDVFLLCVFSFIYLFIFSELSLNHLHPRSWSSLIVSGKKSKSRKHPASLWLKLKYTKEIKWDVSEGKHHNRGSAFKPKTIIKSSFGWGGAGRKLGVRRVGRFQKGMVISSQWLFPILKPRALDGSWREGLCMMLTEQSSWVSGESKGHSDSREILEDPRPVNKQWYQRDGTEEAESCGVGQGWTKIYWN